MYTLQKIKRHIKKKFILISYFFMIIFISCSNDYNPFTDFSNAKAVAIYKTFSDFDTISIFSTETIKVALAVRELIDSFSLIAPSNRRLPDTFVVKRHFQNSFEAINYNLPISLTDTGWKTIYLNTYRSNGDKISQEFRVYCNIPLSQNIVTGYYGDTIFLSTKPVLDNDVIYHWDFGDGNTVSSMLPNTIAVIKMRSNINTGLIWVTDLLGIYKSPKIPFSYYLKDTTGPIIKCINENFYDKDTIITGDSIFYLKLKIWDPAQLQPVYSATINQKPFDIKDDPIYISVLKNIDLAKTSDPFIIYAIDNQYSKNISTKKIWVKYSDTALKSEKVYITVTDPQSITSVSSEGEKTIFGFIEDYYHDSLNVSIKLFVNNIYTGQTFIVRGKYKELWMFRVSLNDGENNIKLVAFNFNGDSLAEKSLVIWYDAALKDTIPPVILDITADGNHVSSYGYIPNSTSILRIIAFDEGSQVDSIWVNGKSLIKNPEGYGLIWFDTVALAHKPQGNDFTIVVKDNHNNFDSVKITLFKNNVPDIVLAPPAIQTISIGSEYVAYIKCVDRDNDIITIQKIEGPPKLSVSSDGTITWTPQLSDTGRQNVLLNIWDGYQSISYSFEIFVSSLSSLPPKIKIDTISTKAQVPAFLEVGKDTLKMHIYSYTFDSTIGPIVYTASLNNLMPLEILNDIVYWIPTDANTGKNFITIIASDRFLRTDTFIANITVVPANRPCSLIVSHNIPITPLGELDLSEATSPETLLFFVKDPDIYAIEKDTATIVWKGNLTQIVLDSSRQFKVILIPEPDKKQIDSLLVFVTDKAGHKDSLFFNILYSKNLTRVFRGKIIINTKTSFAMINNRVINFPLLVRLDTFSVTKSFFLEAAPKGADIKFFKPNGLPLAFEIERWNDSLYLAEIWVRVDTIYPNNDSQYIMLSWGSGSSIQSNGSSVFSPDLGYVGVWHMSNKSRTENINSVTNQFNLVPANTSQPNIFYGKGIIGDCDTFFNDMYLSAGNIPIMQNVSVSAWVYVAQRSGWAKIICKPWNSYSYPYEIYSLEFTGAKDSAVQFHTGLTPQIYGNAFSQDSIQTGRWAYVVGTYDGTTSRIYVNGELAGTYTWTISTIPPVPNNSLPWFVGGWSYRPQESIKGKIDEPRIYNGVLSPDYIKLSYENQRQGSLLLQFR
jgi:hypothetical protein